MFDRWRHIVAQGIYVAKGFYQPLQEWCESLNWARYLHDLQVSSVYCRLLGVTELRCENDRNGTALHTSHYTVPSPQSGTTLPSASSYAYVIVERGSLRGASN